MGFERCHPGVNLIFFATVLTGTMLFSHPLCLAVSVVCAFCYSVQRAGKKAVWFGLCLVVAALLFGLFYASFQHFGVTNLHQNFIGNQLTLESLCYGMALGFRIGAVLMWFVCLYTVFTADKVVYLFGCVSPRISLFLTILLRFVPRIKHQAAKLSTAQKGIGRSIVQGRIFHRVRNLVRVCSMLCIWAIEALFAASTSMQSRGSTLRGRTAFLIYRFDNRDRAFTLIMFGCITLVLMGTLLGQTTMNFNPQLMLCPLTPLTYMTGIAWMILCLLPAGLQLQTQWRFVAAQNKIARSKHQTVR